MKNWEFITFLLITYLNGSCATTFEKGYRSFISRIALDTIEKLFEENLKMKWKRKVILTIFFLSCVFNNFNSLYAIKQFSHNGEHMDTKSMERNKSLTKMLLYLFQKFQIQLHFDIKACNQRIVGNVLAWQINDPSNIQ